MAGDWAFSDGTTAPWPIVIPSAISAAAARGNVERRNRVILMES